MSKRLQSIPARSAAAIGALCALALSLSAAHAASDRVKSACKDDYFRHCSAHALGSESLRQCMRGIGENLSTGCLVALVEAGEITKQDIERHNAKQAAAKAEKPAADPKPVAAAAASAPATASPSKPKSLAATTGPAKPTEKPDAAKPASPTKFASIGKTALPGPADKPKATTPAKIPDKTEAAKVKPAAKVASIGKAPPAPPPPAKPVAKFQGDAKPTAKAIAAPSTKTVAPQPTSKLASKGTATTSKPVASTAALAPTPAKKPVAKQPGMAALSGEGATLAAAAGKRYTRNVCHAKTIAGDPISQTCAIDEKCCFSGLAGKLRCVPQSAPCNGF